MFTVDLFKGHSEKPNESTLTNVIEYILCDVPNFIDVSILQAVISVLAKVRV